MRATRPLVVVLASLAATVLLAVAAPSVVGAAPVLTVELITWNVIGLDSNDVNVGPATYPVGVRVCNSGADPATAVTGSFAWTTANSALEIDGPLTASVGTLVPSSCRDLYWSVSVARSAASYGAARRYQITVSSAEGATASTPSPRELFVEQLISQNRNSVNSISGPAAVTVGDEVTYTVDSNTATNGYEQLEAFLTFPTSVFELLRVAVTYGAPPNARNDTMYADACGWDDVPTSASYRSCIGPEEYPGGKVGGSVIATYTARVIGTGTARLTSAIYDKSGSSYHYNTDFGRAPNLLIVTASAQAPPTATTSVPAPTTTAVSAGATTTSLPTAASATASPPSTNTALGAATPARPLPSTGQADTGLLALLGLSLVLVGYASLSAPRITHLASHRRRALAASPLERSVHALRLALYSHEHEPIAAHAWRLLDSLDRCARVSPGTRKGPAGG